MLRVIILLLIFVALSIIFFHKFRRKLQFRSLKKKYGIVEDNRYSLESMTQLFLRFNKMSDRPIGLGDYAIINLDGVNIPLCYGNVGYKTSPLMETGPSFPTTIFVVINSKAIEEIVLKRQDLFQFAVRKDDISVFLVRDLKKLVSYLVGRQRGGQYDQIT